MKTIVDLVVLWCVLACVPALAGTGSAPTTTCVGISCFSWDYMDLGEANGWWAKWFPACAADNQSPIDIDDTKVKHTTDRITITPVNGRPFHWTYATVYPQSLYNVLNYILMGKDLRVNIVRESAATAAARQAEGKAVTPSSTIYNMTDIRIQFPAEHTINGERPDVEIHYMFKKIHPTEESATADGKSNTKDGSSSNSNHDNNNMMPTNSIMEENVVLTMMAKATTAVQPRSPMEIWLQYMTQYIDGGSIKRSIIMPQVQSVYVYTGSLSYPPCTPNVLYVVGTNVMSIQASTMQALHALNVSGMGTREVKSVGERVVELLSFDAKALVPVFRTTPSPVRYRLKSGDNDYSIIFFRGYVIYLVLVNILLFLMLLWLLWERVSYSYRYNLTWRRPTTGQGVFGAAVRYGRETGATKLRRGRRPAAAESHNSAADGRSTTDTNPETAGVTGPCTEHSERHESGSSEG